MDRDFEIGGKKFKLNKIDAFSQFHIVRRVGPILSELLPAMKDAAKLGDKTDGLSLDEKLDSIGKFVEPIMSGLSKLSNADADYVLFGLLSSVEIQQAAGNWARVATKEMLMMQNLELPVLLNLAGRAFMFNHSGFFAALPQ